MARDIPLGSVPRQQRGVQARDRVFAEAMRLFGERGVAETRVEDITAAAGVAWGTFFRYFPRKEDVLLHAARRHYLEQLIPAVEGGLADPDQPARETGLALYLALLCPAEYPMSVHAAVLREATSRRDRLIAVLGELPSLEVLTMRVIEHGQARGEVRTDTPPLLLTGVVLTATVFTTLFGYFDVVERDPATLADMPSPEPIVTGAFTVAWRGIEPG